MSLCETRTYCAPLNLWPDKAWLAGRVKGNESNVALRGRCVCHRLARAHLDLVKRLFLLEDLDPDGDPGLVVTEAPTGFARAFSSEVAERAVVRDECIVSRHLPWAVWPPVKLPRRCRGEQTTREAVGY